MKLRIKGMLVSCAMIGLVSSPSFARSHSRHSGSSRSSSGYTSGPNDTGGHDYSRHIGATNARQLSTGWTSEHGQRNEVTRDTYRHNRNGTVTHVHGYYHRHRR